MIQKSLLGLCLILTFSQQAYGQQITLSAPDTSTVHGFVFEMPVRIQTDEQIRSWSALVQYSSTLMTLTYIKKEGSVNENIDLEWEYAANGAVEITVDNPQIEIDESPSEPSNIDGELIYLGFNLHEISDLSDQGNIAFTGEFATVNGDVTSSTNSRITLTRPNAPEVGTEFSITGTTSTTFGQQLETALTIGFDPDGKDGQDVTHYPAVVFDRYDARIPGEGKDYSVDLRSYPVESATWKIRVNVPDDNAPVEITWTKDRLPESGFMYLYNPNENTVVDLATDSELVLEKAGVYLLEAGYTTGYEVTLQAGWNLLSNPIVGASNVDFSTFSSSEEPLSYSSQYLSAESYANGNGYWVHSDQSTTATFYGPTQRTLEVDLEAGWNLLGGPACTVNYDAVVENNNALDYFSLYEYNSTYIYSRRMEPGKGYWIRANYATTLRMDCDAISDRIVPELNDNFAAVSFTTDEGASELYFGYITTAAKNQPNKRDDSERYTLPPVSPNSEFEARFADNYWAIESGNPTIYIDGTKEFQVNLQAQPKGDTSVGYDMYVYKNGAVTATETLVLGVPITLNATEVDSIQLGSKTVTNNTITSSNQILELPTALKSNGVFPNPSIATATLSFDLPQVANVSINIFDMLGREVKQVPAQQYSAGTQKVNIDTNDLTSGLYVYRITTPDATARGSFTVKK